MTLPIPILETHGSYYEVGHQIGVAARGALGTMYAETRAEYGTKWNALLVLSKPFLAVTRERLPKVVEEVRGCADGAGIAFDDLFLMSIEELLYEEVRGAERGRGREGERGSQFPLPPVTRHPSPVTHPLSPVTRPLSPPKGCSDLAATAPATRDGHVWIAHNNDLGKSAANQLFVTRFCVTGEPEILAVTVGGLFISIGMNSAGLALTGNQLSANDSRVGVPRLLIVRDILAQTDIDAALASALMPERASSYNNIISSSGRGIVNAEGSATAAAVTWCSDTGGTLAHTNHYLDAKMLQFEGDKGTVAMSASRCARAFDYAQKYRGEIDFDVCARFVRDHVYEPWSVCKHAGQSVTVFSSIIDLSAQKLWLARGNPCASDFCLYPTGTPDAL